MTDATKVSRQYAFFSTTQPNHLRFLNPGPAAFPDRFSHVITRVPLYTRNYVEDRSRNPLCLGRLRLAAIRTAYHHLKRIAALTASSEAQPSSDAWYEAPSVRTITKMAFGRRMPTQICRRHKELAGTTSTTSKSSSSLKASSSLFPPLIAS